MEPLQGSLLGQGWESPALAGNQVFERTLLDDGSWVDLARSWLLGADTLLQHLVEVVPWSQGRRPMYDRVLDDPRLSYRCRHGVELPHPVLATCRDAIKRHYATDLGGPGFNYYRSGSDSVAPHADRELRVLDDTLVAILTLGVRRPFRLRPQAGAPSFDLAPASGDLLVMGGATQLRWTHAVPKVRRCGPRISVSWRAARGAPAGVPLPSR